MMFPFVDNEEEEEQEESLYIPKEYGINFETGQLSGKIVEGYDALLVWVWLALQTPRYRYYIYSEDYGQEYEDLIGKSGSSSSEGIVSPAEPRDTSPVIQIPYPFHCLPSITVGSRTVI